MKNAIQALLVTLVFSALGVFGLLGLGKKFDLAEFVRTAQIHPIWAVAFFASVIAWWLIAGWRIQLLANDKNVTLSRATRAFLLYLFGASTTPGASGANVAMAWYLSQYTNSKRATAVAIFSVSLDLVFYAYALPLSFAYLYFTGIDLHIPVVGSFLGVLVLIGTIVAIGLAYGVAYQAHQLEKLVFIICKVKFLKRFQRSALRFIGETADAMVQMRQLPFSTQVKLHLSTFLNYTFHLAAANLVAATLGYKVDDLGLIATQILLVYFSFFIPTPGGAGYLEFVLGTSIAVLGIPEEAIVPYVLIWRTLSYFLYYLIGPFIGGSAVLAQAQAAKKAEAKA